MYSFPLIGAGGEPVDFARTISGHGVTSLAPMSVDAEARTLTVTVAMPSGAPKTVRIRAEGDRCVFDVAGQEISNEEAAHLLATVRHILRLDADLTGFYALAEVDPRLRWVTRGAGRMTRCQTVFEDVVKTICTTNCAWSATIRMVNALVQHLGEASTEAIDGSPIGRSFPTPAAMAAADVDFYRSIVRCGYRGAYLKSLAQSVVDGAVDLERYATISEEELPDDLLAKELIALPGVGPYAAAHIMMMLGRSSRLILDSWTRPTYAAVCGRESVPDAEIAEAFAGYGRYAGLAFWMSLTETWIDDANSQ